MERQDKIVKIYSLMKEISALLEQTDITAVKVFIDAMADDFFDEYIRPKESKKEDYAELPEGLKEDLAAMIDRLNSDAPVILEEPIDGDIENMRPIIMVGQEVMPFSVDTIVELLKTYSAGSKEMLDLLQDLEFYEDYPKAAEISSYIKSVIGI